MEVVRGYPDSPASFLLKDCTTILSLGIIIEHKFVFCQEENVAGKRSARLDEGALCSKIYRNSSKGYCNWSPPEADSNRDPKELLTIVCVYAILKPESR
jgi:hypothetical protein